MGQHTDTIAAIITPQGVGAIAVIRLSGNDAFTLVEKVFRKKNGKHVNLSGLASHSVHLGVITDGRSIVDEVLLSLFRAPASYTGENVVEISCHGSVYIQQQLMQLFIREGARTAGPGEYTLRAFLNGKMDLSQAEAVADLIASSSAMSHQVAVKQMRGGFSSQVKVLREQLVHFASLVELELDFSEEDVEFADREELKKLVDAIRKVLEKLIDSFSVGNVIKNGVPVVIAGKPNVGKSTLLNTLVNEDRAIVSEMPGTTRDTVEEEIVLGGILFRFIDTAGIRETTDAIESVGVHKTYQKISQSALILYLFDAHEMTANELSSILAELKEKASQSTVKIIPVANKIDKENAALLKKEFSGFENILFISAKEALHIDTLIETLLVTVNKEKVSLSDTIITNVRHYEALVKADQALNVVRKGLDMDTHVTGDLLAADIRGALRHLGDITGQVTTDDLLDNIFSRFCIGK